jgi:Glycosyl transferases group 1
MLWHVHGAWTTSFVSGEHTYLIPVTPDRGEFGRGRAQTEDWPQSAIELSPEELAAADVDLLVLQRPQELRLAAAWLGRTPGRDIPAVYVEHSPPRGDVPDTRHPVADRDDLVLVHVTHFNDLFWMAGGTRRAVIEHGVPEPKAVYSGELPRIGAVIHEPMRRWRVTGTDLLPRFADVCEVDLFGRGAAELASRMAPRVLPHENPPQRLLHQQLALRRAYLHPFRWTSLGLSLLEAMMMGMPVIALGTTEVIEAVPEEAGVVSTQVDVLVEAARWLIEDLESARNMGIHAQAAARRRYGLPRFLEDWDRLFKEMV